MISISNSLVRELDHDANGDAFIPASQRPDGTWRKARRVKEGYIPQEEVPLYESKGKKLMNKLVEPVKVDGFIGHKTIPGLFVEEKSGKKKKSKKIDDLTVNVQKLKIDTKPKVEKVNKMNVDKVKVEKAKVDKVKIDKAKVEKVEKVKVDKVKIDRGKVDKAKVERSIESVSTDPVKKLKNLKKRLREVETLEQKIRSGEIARPEPEQLAKLNRKTELLIQISELEV